MGAEQTDLAQMKCVPCQRGTPPLPDDQQRQLLERLGRGWRIIDGHHLEKEYPFHDFAQALAFTNRVGQLAEEVGHHPDIHLGWGRARITIWTHKIDGLSESDFVLAAKIDTRAL